MTEEIGTSNLLRTWANDGVVVTPSNAKINEGWLRGEQPPHEWMNYIHNVLGQKINHALSRGAADWNSGTEYLAGAIVNHAGDIWLALSASKNSEPSAGNSNWSVLLGGRDNLSDLANASTARTNLGLGAAAVVNITTDAVDTTLGRVSAFIDYTSQTGNGLPFGLGATHAIVIDTPSIGSTSANAIARNGFYSTNGNTTDIPVSGFGSVLYHSQFNSNEASQLFHARNGDLFTRRKSGGAWEDWQNLTGTFGSNANGEFFRFANGLQVCKKSLDLGSITATGAGTLADPYRTTGGLHWIFPAAFAANPDLAGNAEIVTQTAPERAAYLRNGQSDTTQAINIQAFRTTSLNTANTVTARMIAVGRWF